MEDTVGMANYEREETTSRMMVADRPYGEFCEFYSISPEFIGYTPVQNCPRQVLLGDWTSHIM
jgi:hypothetical protein